MPTLVSTGQITIVDTNDARPITAWMTANPGTQQVFTKDESTVNFTPSWYSANTNTGIQLSPQVYVGTTSSSTNVTNLLTNRKFTLAVGGAALTNASSETNFVDDSNTAVSTPYTIVADGSNTYLRIRGNLKDTTGAYTYFFEGDYTDPATGLVSHVVCQITLNTVKTGTNAVYINKRGNDTIEVGASTTTYGCITADLVRSAGIDTTGLTYKWYEATSGTQISTSLSGYATKYGFKTTAAGANPVGGSGDLGVNVPAVGAGNIYNTMTIAPAAVTDMMTYRVDITDADAKTYSQYFTVYDVSDPYQLSIISSTGDKLQNGQGSTVLTPVVYYGAVKVPSLTGWTFTWYFYDKNGKRAAFVDTTKISTAGGATISAQTGTTAAVFTYGGPSYAFVAGDIIKVVKTNGDAYYYEVASSTTNQVTIRVPATTNTWLSATDFPAPAVGDFNGGKIFGCTSGGTRSTAAGATITVTGDEIDVKGNITAEANRP